MLSIAPTAPAFVIAAALAAVPVPWLAATAEIPRVMWRTSVQSADRDFELRAAALAADSSSLWLGIASRPRGAARGPGTLLLTSISAAGVPTGRLIAASGSALGDLEERRGLLGMGAGRDRALVLGIERPTAGAGLATLDAASEQIAAPRSLSFTGGTPAIARLVPRPAGYLLAVGAMGTRPFVAELSADGSVVWQRVLEQDNVNLDDGAPTADGGAIVTGRQGADPASTRVWIAKLSSTGQIERQAAFDGWLGSIAQGTGGRYLVVTTDRARAAQVTLIGLGPALETRWTRAMPAGQPLTPSFRIAPVRGGGYVVAGIKDRGLWVSRVTEDGGAIWTDARTPTPPEVEVTSNVELLGRDETFFLLYTVFVVEGKEQRQLVRVMRFAA